ncbi:hypothetical protein K504DRAFT_385383 [Pleomassaria siparia CBS 279.74]|uniref:Peptidase S54 rhomboid domain-containing protein n=1 Tax=Pleomassaria siparia CBS 279.74 TaxID=1314801 RepID=A0A6G1K0X9_9PLEO|nr:hypothetical protein K504DRAFT_385383 [Pleomassaria siparia CBS 279.74]
MTSAFARRFGSYSHSRGNANTRGSLVFSLQFRQSAPSIQHSRSFSVTPPSAAKVHSPPPPEPRRAPYKPPPPKKRTVKIGPLPAGEVENEVIRSIFGTKVSHTDGNNVLRILHHRRTSGSLADYGVDNLGHTYAHVNRTLATKALEWLRRVYPVDEGAAAEVWAEREANRIAYELWLADPENDSKYKDPARVWRDQQKEIDKENEAQQEEEGQRIGMLRVGPSEFERNIAEKRRQRLEAVTKQAEEKENKAKEEMKLLETGEWVKTPRGTGLMKPGQTAYVDIFGREQISHRKEIQAEYRKKAELPFKTAEELLAQTTVPQRLYPMSAFVLVVCLLSWGFAHYYVPPSPAYRLLPDIPLTAATILGLVAVNFSLWFAWRWTPLWPVLTQYFMHTPAYPRVIQSVTNVFAHLSWEHLVGNMVFLTLAGSVCHEMVGRGVFLGTYVSAGAVGTLATLYWANLGRGAILAHSMGASAAVYGIVALYLLLTDRERIQIPFVKDGSVSFWPKTMFAAMFILEISSALRGSSKIADHASHFGGLLTGASVAGFMHYRGFHQQRRMELVGLGLGDVERKAGPDDKTIDFGAIIKEEAKAIKDQVKRFVNK